MPVYLYTPTISGIVCCLYLSIEVALNDFRSFMRIMLDKSEYKFYSDTVMVILGINVTMKNYKFFCN